MIPTLRLSIPDLTKDIPIEGLRLRWFSRLLKNPLFAEVSMDLVGLSESLTLWPGVCGPLAARIGVPFGSGRHQVGDSANSLGSRTRL